MPVLSREIFYSDLIEKDYLIQDIIDKDYLSEKYILNKNDLATYSKFSNKNFLFLSISNKTLSKSLLA